MFKQFDIDKIRNDYYKKVNELTNENEFSIYSSITENKKNKKENEKKIINQNEPIITENKDKLFNFDILRVRNDYYKKVNENNNSSILPCQKDEKENEGKIIKSNENSIIINKKERQDSSHNIQNKIPIDFIKNNINDDYKDNLDSIENMEKSTPINPKKPTYYIPFKKIFKENIKKIDIDELKYNDCGKNHKENAKIIIPFEKIRKRTEETYFSV